METYGDFKDLPRRTAAENPRCNGYQRELASLV